MSPARRMMLSAVAALALLAGVVLVVLRVGGPDVSPVAQDRPGPVLLVPGYGGDTSGLRALAARLEREGRSTTLVDLPGDGTGDLEVAAQVLGAAADQVLRSGAPSVDVVGYSAGGVIARLWLREGGAEQVRRVVTLGSPHHGTRLAALGRVFATGACPPACQQLVPGSPLLDRLNDGDETPDGPQWLSVWTEQDTVVTPPPSARLEGAQDVPLQQLCPGRQVHHGQLPHDAAVQAIVLQALSVEPLAAPDRAVCG